MKCPKCSARVGIMKQTLATDAGFASGVICYICGFWKQEFLFERNMDLPHLRSGGFMPKMPLRTT